MIEGVRATVVGAGVAGLTTALRLLEAGWQVRVVTADPPEATTSALAAAVWFPTHVGPPERVQPWGSRTFDVLAAQAARGEPAGVVMRDTLVLGRAPLGEPDWVTSVGPVRAADPGDLPPGYTHGLHFQVPLVEMPVYLRALGALVTRAGARVEGRRVQSLDELCHDGADAVVNCSGLGARTLVGDESVYPVRGQIVRVANPGLTVSVRDEHHPEGRAYVHPRSTDCILGGTLDEHDWSTDVDPAVAASILRRCLDLVPALAGVSVLEHPVGLRPGRPEVRLEVDPAYRSGPRVVHNYGHGGAGVTLSWGCAEEVVRLLEG